MSKSDVTHFVFVDFENVPKVDLAAVQGKPVHVTLLIGQKQTKTDWDLTEQIQRFPTQVKLVRVGASGHNALDMILAYYLGQAAQVTPGAQFSIVSKDKDFEPMIAHLTANSVRVVRCDTFTGAFQPVGRKTSPLAKAPAAKSAPPVKKVPEDRLTKLISRFRESPQHHPKKRTTLLHHIQTFYGNKLTEAEVLNVVAHLVTRGVVSIDEKSKVTYPT